MHDILTTLSSFSSTMLATHRWRNRKSFEIWQHGKLNAWLDNHLHNVSYYQNLPKNLDALPVIDKSIVMNSFEDFNCLNMTTEQAWNLVDTNTTRAGYVVGASTGTSGNRGLFVISNEEQFLWLGSILAKALPEVLWRRQRVAIILPRNTSLYESARQTRRIDLRFFDLGLGVESWSHKLESFNPTCIVAPPKVLRLLAEQKAKITPAKLFSAAETLDVSDRAIIEAYFSLKLGQIYMATEGLFGVSCSHGRLHLAEDSTAFEFEPVGNGLVSPLVTSFQRKTQIIARYRMNDLLRLSRKPCPCGSPLTAVDEVVGRMDDVFKLLSDKGEISITPDVLRDAVLKADRKINDFRLVQTGPDFIELSLSPELSDECAQAALSSVTELLKKRNARANIKLVRRPLEIDVTRKLRRVECRLQGD